MNRDCNIFNDSKKEFLGGGSVASVFVLLDSLTLLDLFFNFSELLLCFFVILDDAPA